MTKVTRCLICNESSEKSLCDNCSNEKICKECNIMKNSNTFYSYKKVDDDNNNDKIPFQASTSQK